MIAFGVGGAVGREHDLGAVRRPARVDVVVVARGDLGGTPSGHAANPEVALAGGRVDGGVEQRLAVGGPARLGTLADLCRGAALDRAHPQDSVARRSLADLGEEELPRERIDLRLQVLGRLAGDQLHAAAALEALLEDREGAADAVRGEQDRVLSGDVGRGQVEVAAVGEARATLVRGVDVGAPNVGELLSVADALEDAHQDLGALGVDVEADQERVSAEVRDLLELDVTGQQVVGLRAGVDVVALEAGVPFLPVDGPDRLSAGIGLGAEAGDGLAADGDGRGEQTESEQSGT